MAIDLNGSTGISLDDNEKINIGNDSDLQIYHDGSHSYITDQGTGNLRIRGTSIELSNADGSKRYGEYLDGDAVKLYHNGSKKFETTSTGVDVTGTAVVDGLTVSTSASGFASQITNNNDSSQGLQVRTSDNDGGQFILDLQSSSSATGTDYASKFVVTKNGNVGIGTSSPNSPLEVSNGTENQRVAFGTGEVYLMARNASSYITQEYIANQHVFTGYGDNSSNEAMRIDASGNVGIGRSSQDSVNLDIEDDSSGNINALRIRNRGQQSGASVSALWSLNRDGSDVNFTAASIKAVKEQNWTTNSLTVDGAMVFSTVKDESTSEKMRLTSYGSLLVGTTSDQNIRLTAYSDNNWAAEFGRQAGTHGVVRFTIGGTQVGSITANGSSTSYVTSSDYRLKENVVDLTGASARVNQLNPSRFNFIADDTNTLVDGFLAHEVATVVPEAITGTKDAMMDEEYEVTPATGDIYTPATDDVDEVIHSADAEHPETLEDGQQWRETTAAVMGTRSVPDYQGIDQSKLVPLLTAALQEALTEIASLKTRVQALEA